MVGGSTEDGSQQTHVRSACCLVDRELMSVSSWGQEMLLFVFLILDSWPLKEAPQTDPHPGF